MYSMKLIAANVITSAALVGFTCLLALPKIAADASSQVPRQTGSHVPPVTTPKTATCGQGWFGPKCEYKCRCVNDKCDNTGACEEGARCHIGWFGPRCEYEDLAFNKTNSFDLTDENDETCTSDSSLSELEIRFRIPYLFSWLRLVYNSTKSRSFEVFLKDGSSLLKCHNKVQQTEFPLLDIHCYVNVQVEAVIVKGDLGNLCSLYINGGRQVALKQKTLLTPQYFEVSTSTGNKSISFQAWKAVDGNVNPDFYGGRACSKTRATADTAVSWRVKLSVPHNIDRYMIYFPNNSSIYAYGLSIEGYDSDLVKLFEHPVSGSELTPVFRLIKRTPNVTYVNVKSSAPTLELCEVELYGDSVCPIDKYGVDCERTCYCPERTPCFASTGECHPGCDPGYEGETCLPCRPGMYGTGCAHNCSQFCSKDDKMNIMCHNVNGSCLGGCTLGYQPPMCTEAGIILCKAGRYGPGCKATCSPGCARSVKNNEVDCDYLNGSCVHGCASGYHGTNCNTSTHLKPCGPGKFGAACSLQCSKHCANASNATIPVCDFLNGTCSRGCHSGYRGAFCNMTCALETYGVNCAKHCSATCEKKIDDVTSSCNDLNGACLHGCVTGYVGAFCTERCRKDMYGEDCKHECSTRCAPPLDSASPLCNSINGSCLYGCIEGYIGDDCDQGLTNPSVAEVSSSDGWNTVYVMALFSPMALIFIIKFCVKPRNKGDSVPAEETAVEEGDEVTQSTVSRDSVLSQHWQP